MTDVHDIATRSYNMSKVRSVDTKPEMLVRKFLHSKGFRFRLHNKGLPGKPDLTLPKYRVVIFVNGCFWHGHEGCKYFVIPKTRTDWWLKKINRNKQLDNENFYVLQETGWNIITIFECELKKDSRDKTLNDLINKIY